MNDLDLFTAARPHVDPLDEHSMAAIHRRVFGFDLVDGSTATVAGSAADATIRSLAPRRQARRRSWISAVAVAAAVVGIVVGLVAIGTNHNDASTSNDSARLRWLVTELPAGWKATTAFGPDHELPSALLPSTDNLYATNAAPQGPVLAVSGSEGAPDSEIVPGAGSFESNHRELVIDGRRAAFADGAAGVRILYIESNGHWLRLTARRVDDAVLTELARSAVRSDDGTAIIPPPDLTDGLKLIAAAGTFYGFGLFGAAAAGVSTYSGGGTDGANLTLRVSEPTATMRAGVGLQSELVAETVRAHPGFTGSGSAFPDNPTFRIVYWEHDGLAFYLTGEGISQPQLLAAAASIRPASSKEWAALVNNSGTDVVTGTVATETTFVPQNTIAPTNPEVRDVPVEVSVAVKSANEQTWSGVLPTGEKWSLDLSRVFNTMSLLGDVDGQSAGISPLVVNFPSDGTILQGFDGGAVVTADERATAMRIVRSNGDRYTIPLHDIPGTNGLRIAVLGLPGNSPEVRIEMIDADAHVIESYVDGITRDADGQVIQPG